jgi:hypothetical protein
MDQLPKYVLDAIWGGRAVLVAGQDVVPRESLSLLGPDSLKSNLRAALLQPSQSDVSSHFGYQAT